MRAIRRVFVLAVFAIITILTPLGRAAASEHCGAPCKQQQVIWYLSASLTNYRQWIGWQLGHTPWALCVKAHESDTAGGYRAYDGSGNWGAYQFDRQTFDSVVGRHGRPDLVGKLPVEPVVPSWDQDWAAAELHVERGDQPWGSRCLNR